MPPSTWPTRAHSLHPTSRPPLPAKDVPAKGSPDTNHDAQQRNLRTQGATKKAQNPLAMHPTATKTLPEAVLDLLATVASASSTITNFIRSVRAAHTDLAALTRELADLKLVLELLRDDSDVPPPLQPRIVALLDSCGDVLARIDRVLAGCWVESLGKARWGMRERDAATSLRFGTQVHREALGLLLEVANLTSTINEQAGTASVDDAEELREQAGRLLGDVGRLRDTVPQVKSDSEASAAALQSYLDELTSYAQTVCHVVLGGPRQDDPKEAITIMMENGGPATAQHKMANGSVSCGHAHAVSADSTQTLGLGIHHKRDESSDKIVVEPNLSRATSNVRNGYRDKPVAGDQPLEAIGPWYPPENQSVPYYRHDSLQSVRSGTGPSSSTSASQHSHSHSNSRSEHLLPPINAGDSDLGLPWSAPKLISTSSWSSTPQTPPAVPAAVSPPRSKRTSSQQSTTGSVFDGVTSARTSITTDLLSFPVPPRKPVFQPAFEPPQSVPSCASSIRPTTLGSRRSSEVTLDHLPLPPTRAEVFGQSPSNSPGMSHSPLARPLTPLSNELQHPALLSSMELIPEKRLFSKEKGPGVFHIEVSPAGTTLTAKHSNNTLSVWSLVTNTLQSVIKVPAKTQVEARSRTYFIRSHAIVSESMATLALTTSFGNTIELWSWSRRKKKQTIDRAPRWAASREDAYACPGPSLAVYRGDDSPTIDLFRFSRDPAFKKPFTESGPGIDLRTAGLPFPMRLPELAFCATAPLLVAAAGPRPRDPPNAQKVVLAAWTLDGDGARQSSVPYRWVVPEHTELHMALPTSLAAYGDLAVSTWVPASSMPVKREGGGFWNKPVAVTARYILVWDMGTNTTRTHAVPNAQCVVSGDCRYVAYCDAVGGKMGVVETGGGREVWSWPCDRLAGSLHYRQLDDLKRVTEFAFSADGKALLVGDCDGSVGVYNIRLGRGD